MKHHNLNHEDAVHARSLYEAYKDEPIKLIIRIRARVQYHGCTYRAFIRAMLTPDKKQQSHC